MTDQKAAEFDSRKVGEIAAFCLSSRLRRADRAIMQLYDEALRPCGLRMTQFALLVAVRRLGPVNQKDLARRTVTDRTTLTRNLVPLGRRGLVRIEPGEDRRVRLVSLTPKGQRALSRAYPHWKAAQARVRKLLGKERMQGLVAELGAAADAVAGN